MVNLHLFNFYDIFEIPCMCVEYVEVILQVPHGRQNVEPLVERKVRRCCLESFRTLLRRGPGRRQQERENLEEEDRQQGTVAGRRAIEEEKEEEEEEAEEEEEDISLCNNNNNNIQICIFSVPAQQPDGQ